MISTDHEKERTGVYSDHLYVRQGFQQELGKTTGTTNQVDYRGVLGID